MGTNVAFSLPVVDVRLAPRTSRWQQWMPAATPAATASLAASGADFGSAATCTAVLAAAAVGFAATSSGLRAAAASRRRAAPGRVARFAVVSAAGKESDALGSTVYLSVLVQTPDGETVQVEAKPSDSVRVLKAMIQLQTGTDEDKQELSIVGGDGSVQLRDDDTLSGSGIEEGTKLVMTVAEGSSDAPGGDDPDTIPEGATRVFVKCDVAPGKTKLLTLYVSPTEMGKEVKERAYAHFVKEQPIFAKTEPKYFGLFMPQSPFMDDQGNLRYLLRDERVNEKVPGSELGFSGDEELIFADLFWCEA